MRTPPVDVPVRVLSACTGPAGSVICLLLGSTTAMPTERIVALHGTPARLRGRGTPRRSTTRSKRGYVLEEDRAAIETFAHPELVPE